VAESLMNARHVAAHTAGAALFSLLLASCGGGDGSPASPSPPPSGGGGGTPVVTNTITITSAGVDNKNIAIAVGTKVTFVNNDTRSHQMSSNPHPVHTDCPGLNMPALQPGQRAESQALDTARTCGFHDHENPGDSSLQGSVTIR
jgi:plastocyanin